MQANQTSGFSALLASPCTSSRTFPPCKSTLLPSMASLTSSPPLPHRFYLVMSGSFSSSLPCRRQLRRLGYYQAAMPIPATRANPSTAVSSVVERGCMRMRWRNTWGEYTEASLSRAGSHSQLLTAGNLCHSYRFFFFNWCSPKSSKCFSVSKIFWAFKLVPP